MFNSWIGKVIIPKSSREMGPQQVVHPVSFWEGLCLLYSLLEMCNMSLLRLSKQNKRQLQSLEWGELLPNKQSESHRIDNRGEESSEMIFFSCFGFKNAFMLHYNVLYFMNITERRGITEERELESLVSDGFSYCPECKHRHTHTHTHTHTHPQCTSSLAILWLM